jgi:hypothetical protein
VGPLNASYGRTFWVSWKAIGLDGPPAEGEFRISVNAMQDKGPGVAFRVNAGNKP